ncbi:putative protein kinase UbiB [Anaplasma phagocytophilum]|uniref:2-polyprenylphenol 6-hydroxylase n=1 Tax=Anaplasma phagocytophilum TaxID=948 RepID=UPI0007DF97DB|nr:2-polyprenylphenol 6-hydroxylase [Anaplasma phagocytophilum]SCV63725.1 putative protein kinase UbiB [Anaplasma phagocytophilum]
MFSSISGLARLCKIGATLLRYGIVPNASIFSNRKHKRNYGERVHLCLRSLGPTFIKFGQFLASRADIVGEEVAGNLLTLCDKLTPFPYSQVVSIIESQFHKKMDEIFLEFDEEPVAAASIAQVHRARTLDGELKAVKVLRPGIEASFRADIALMRKIADISSALGILGRFKLPQLVEMFSDICKLELDLRFEAASADELRENLRAESSDFYVPKVDWKHTSRRVLTLQWVEGTPIYRVDELQNKELLAKNLIIAFCNQVYRDGFFHADMHPGNLMVDANSRIIVVDFGIMGRLDEETCFYITEILVGFINRDYRRVAAAHFDAGYVPERFDQFVTACRSIWEPIADVDDTKNFSTASLLAQLFKITADFDMCVQPKLLLLQKSMVLVEGICRQLVPEMNFWKIAELWVKDHYENIGYVERLKQCKAYRSMMNIGLLVSKIDRSLDIVISHGQAANARKSGGITKSTFCLTLVIAFLTLIILFK